MDSTSDPDAQRIIPLEDLSSDRREVRTIQNLEPVDGGSGAWRLLLASFTFEALLWGFPLSFGVFQDYYSTIPEFSNSSYISVVGTLATGIAYLGAPLMTPLVKTFPRYQRQMIWAGWPLCIGGLIAASFVTSIPGLILTQGIMYGTGFVLFYYPIISMVNEFWVVRRGMAWGIIASASGASGVVMPFVVQALLQKYGFRTALRAIAVALTLLTGPLLPLFRARLPAAEQSVMARTDWSFLKRPLFWLYNASNITQGLGFFFPALYLPSYASSIHLSSTKGALLLALMSAAQVAGQFTFGYLSDSRVPVDVLLILSTSISAIASLALWGLSKSLGPLIAFALLYGFFAYGYVSMRVRMGTAVTDSPSAALPVFSIFVSGQGFGNVLAGPISASLLSRAVRMDAYGADRYEAVVLFTGSCMLLSATAVASRYLRPIWLKINRVAQL